MQQLEFPNNLEFKEFDLVLRQLDDEPISGAELGFKARRYHASGRVIEFFETLPNGTVFKNKQDLLRGVRQTSLFNMEES